MRHRVAVLLATYDGARFLSEQLGSILAQVDVDVTVIARDDGSTDETLARLTIWRDENPARMRLVEDDRGRLGSASANFFRLIEAVDASEFEFFAFADQDDIWLPDKLARAIAQLQATKADGYSSNLLTIREGGAPIALIEKAQPQKQWDYLFKAPRRGAPTYYRRARSMWFEP